MSDPTRRFLLDQGSRIPRSFLFLPGDKLSRFHKAASSGAHAIVIDLEDAVGLQAKDEARSSVAKLLEVGYRLLVRINSLDTHWYDDDIRMLKALPAVGVMVPKANETAMLRTLEALPGRQTIALIETVQGVLESEAVARVTGVTRIAFGSIDFESDSGIADEEEAMTSIRVQLVLHSRGAGLLPPIDGVSTDFNDVINIKDSSARSRRLGFGGKLCIHPNQVAPINEAFSPTPVEVQWAERVVAAFSSSKGAATSVDGKMIDKPVVQQARRILANRSAMTADEPSWASPITQSRTGVALSLRPLDGSQSISSDPSLGSDSIWHPGMT